MDAKKNAIVACIALINAIEAQTKSNPKPFLKIVEDVVKLAKEALAEDTDPDPASDKKTEGIIKAEEKKYQKSFTATRVRTLVETDDDAREFAKWVIGLAGVLAAICLLTPIVGFLYFATHRQEDVPTNLTTVATTLLAFASVLGTLATGAASYYWRNRHDEVFNIVKSQLDRELEEKVKEKKANEATGRPTEPTGRSTEATERSTEATGRPSHHRRGRRAHETIPIPDSLSATSLDSVTVG